MRVELCEEVPDFSRLQNPEESGTADAYHQGFTKELYRLLIGRPIVSERDLHHIDEERHCVKHKVAEGRTHEELKVGCLSLNDVNEGKHLVAGQGHHRLDCRGDANLLEDE